MRNLDSFAAAEPVESQDFGCTSVAKNISITRTVEHTTDAIPMQLVLASGSNRASCSDDETKYNIGDHHKPA